MNKVIELDPTIVTKESIPGIEYQGTDCVLVNTGFWAVLITMDAEKTYRIYRVPGRIITKPDTTAESLVKEMSYQFLFYVSKVVRSISIEFEMSVQKGILQSRKLPTPKHVLSGKEKDLCQVTIRNKTLKKIMDHKSLDESAGDFLEAAVNSYINQLMKK